MSGSSTLRICLAAMAPALTEVTARLKLQDTSVKRESLPPRLENNSNDSKIPAVQRSCQVISVDLNALGGIKTPKVEDRPASHLSHTVKRNGTHPDPKRPAAVVGGENTRNCHFSCTAGSPNTLSNIKALNIAAAHSIAEEAPGGFSFRANQLIDNLKIMNQPQIVADKPVEQDKAAVNPSSFGEGSANATSCIKFAIKPPVMVNGNNELTRSSEADLDVNCLGKRQVQLKKDVQPQEDKIQFTASSTQTNTSNKGMGMCLQNSSTYPTSGLETSSKTESQMDEKAKEDLRKESGKKQVYLERKVDILLRRLKRMKGKVVEAHTREQLKCFVSFQHKNLQKVAKTIKSEAPGPDELKEHFLSSEEVKNMSTAQLVRLVKTYQPNQSAAASGDVSAKSWSGGSSAVVMDSTLREQSLRTSERLAQRIQAAAAELDSDATASSSGGESGDEDTPSPSHPVDLPPLGKRAEWKWAVDRSAVVSRWTWLQAQVSDLEYRIRQQSQVHRQLRNSKGGVVLGDQPTAVELFRKLHGMPSRHVGSTLSDAKPALDSEISPCNISAVMSNVDRQASRLSQSLGNCLSPASSTIGSPAGSSKMSSPFVNGLTDSPSSSSATCGTAESSPTIPSELWLKGKASDLFEHISNDATCQAARCRPLRSYRKRKILRTIELYKTSLKAARLSDIRCRCYPPANPCPICGGRYNNTLTIDPDTMSMKERVAILDPSFHPVLSFPHDIQLSIHCEGLLKSGLWQKSLSRRSRVGEFRKQKVLTLVSEPPPRKGKNRGQKGRNNNSTSVINFSTKIKNKYETKKTKATGSKASSVKPRVHKVKKKAAKAAREALKKNQPEEEEEDFDDYLEADYTARDGGLAGSASQSSLKDMRDIPHRKRKVDTSFDINNIVIPLSMAASARVEQPQYKEIVTPKWREVSEGITSAELIDSSITKKLEKTNGVTLPTEQQKLNTSLDEEAEEDLSDDRFAARHHSLEQEEKKRFRNFVQYPPVRRNRARPEASSAVVPSDKQMSTDRPDLGDPVPAVGSLGEDGYLSSRPSTPLWHKSYQSLYIQSSSVDDSMDSLQHQLLVRRRTMSFSKRDRSGSVMSEDVHNAFIDVGGVEPWPRRTFPLSEEDYRLMQDDLPPSCEPVHHRAPRRLAEPSGKVYVGGSTENMDDVLAVPSPHPSIESASSAGDDLNDPEWMGGDASKRSRTRRIANDDPSDPDWTGTDTPRRNKNKR